MNMSFFPLLFYVLFSVCLLGFRQGTKAEEKRQSQLSRGAFHISATNAGMIMANEFMTIKTGR